MRWGIIFVFAIFAHTATHAGFLVPMEFPKTASDLSFVDRMALDAAGYAPYESEYDEDGNCISGCSYVKMKLEDQIAAMERWNAFVDKELEEDYGYTKTEDGALVPPSKPIEFPEDNRPAKTEFPGEYKQCSVQNQNFGNTDLPSKSPLGYVTCISSDYGVQRKMSWYKTTKVHHGIDLRAKIGTPLYAPANGTVVTVFNMNASCGNGIIIKHPSNYRTQYCHLNEVLVSRGDNVSAGCLIGYTGNTGPTTGPHLHYAVQKITSEGNQPVNPRKFMEPEHEMCH